MLRLSAVRGELSETAWHLDVLQPTFMRASVLR